jgi:hypothetical protein
VNDVAALINGSTADTYETDIVGRAFERPDLSSEFRFVPLVVIVQKRDVFPVRGLDSRISCCSAASISLVTNQLERLKRIDRERVYRVRRRTWGAVVNNYQLDIPVRLVENRFDSL